MRNSEKREDKIFKSGRGSKKKKKRIKILWKNWRGTYLRGHFSLPSHNNLFWGYNCLP